MISFLIYTCNEAFKPMFLTLYQFKFGWYFRTLFRNAENLSFQTESHGTSPIEPWDPTWNLLYLAYELTQNTTLWKALWEILRANFLNSSHQFLEFKSKEAIQHHGANSLHLTKKQEKARCVYVSQEMKV